MWQKLAAGKVLESPAPRPDPLIPCPIISLSRKSEAELSNACGWQTALLGVSRATHRWKRFSRFRPPVPHSFIKSWFVYIGFWLKPSPVGVVLLTFGLDNVLVRGPFRIVIITSNLIRMNTSKDKNVTLTCPGTCHSLCLRSVISLNCIIYVRMFHSSCRVSGVVMNTLSWKIFSSWGYEWLRFFFTRKDRHRRDKITLHSVIPDRYTVPVLSEPRKGGLLSVLALVEPLETQPVRYNCRSASLH
jgi:hypothetical protein